MIEILIIISIIYLFYKSISFIISIFLPNIHHKINNIFNKEINVKEDFKHYQKQNNKHKETKKLETMLKKFNENQQQRKEYREKFNKKQTKKPHNITKVKTTEDKYKETKKLEAMLKNINIQNTSKPQQNMYDTIKKTKPKRSPYQLGKKYEEQVGKHYENLGYYVIYHGIKKKKKDNGIDLIATAGNETLFIQCKNNQNSTINQIKLKEFIGNCTEFIEKNPNKYQNVKRIFIVAKDNTNYGTKKYIENNKSIEYKIIPYLNL